MKLLIIIAFITAISLRVSAQTQNIFLIGRRAYQPALVIVTHDREYLVDSTTFKMVKPKWIAGSYVGAFVVNPDDSVKYGKAAAIGGVNRYRLDDKKYPQAYEKLIKFMKYVGPADSSTYTPKNTIELKLQ